MASEKHRSKFTTYQSLFTIHLCPNIKYLFCMNSIIIPSENGNWCVSPEKIIRVQSMDNYSKIFFDDARPLVVSKVLLWFELRLPNQLFTRVHRSHLVNRNYVAAINGSVIKYVQLTNGETISISRRKKLFAITNLGIVSKH